MKKIRALSVLSLLLVPAVAGAQEALPELQLRLPPDVAACVERCMAGTCVDPAIVPTCRQAPAKRAVKRARRARQRRVTLSSRLRVVERRLTTLEEQVGVLRQGNVSEELAGLRTQLEDLTSGIRRLDRELAELSASTYSLAQDHEDLKDRVDALEKKASPIRVEPRLGGTLLYGVDNTFYSGFLLGPTLVLQLTDRVHALVGANALLSFSESPLGTQVRGGIGIELHPKFVLETALSASWVGYDDRLNAKSAFIMADAGLIWRPVWKLNVGASLLLGAEFDQDTPNFALGGIATVGLEF
jgi:hypothetical protein